MPKPIRDTPARRVRLNRGRGPTYPHPMTKNIRILALSALAASTLVLAACGGNSSSDATSAAPSESPIGGGSASCDQATLEGLAQAAATDSGAEWVSSKSVECVDGYALVFGITKTGDIEQTTAFVFQAEGPVWALNQLDAICADGGGADVPAQIKDQACALR